MNLLTYNLFQKEIEINEKRFKKQTNYKNENETWCFSIQKCAKIINFV